MLWVSLFWGDVTQHVLRDDYHLSSDQYDNFQRRLRLAQVFRRSMGTHPKRKTWPHSLSQFSERRGLCLEYPLKAFAASVSLHSSLEEDTVTHFCHAWYQEYEAMLSEALAQA